MLWANAFKVMEGGAKYIKSVFNPGKDDVTSENWEQGFPPLYQPFVDSQNGVVET